MNYTEFSFVIKRQKFSPPHPRPPKKKKKKLTAGKENEVTLSPKMSMKLSARKYIPVIVYVLPYILWSNENKYLLFFYLNMVKLLGSINAIYIWVYDNLSSKLLV
jgi:hypothetical protein